MYALLPKTTMVFNGSIILPSCSNFLHAAAPTEMVGCLEVE